MRRALVNKKGVTLIATVLVLLTIVMLSSALLYSALRLDKASKNLANAAEIRRSVEQIGEDYTTYGNTLLGYKSYEDYNVSVNASENTLEVRRKGGGNLLLTVVIDEENNPVLWRYYA